MRARYQVSFARARDDLLDELRRMGCPDDQVVVSSHVRTRLDGLPYAHARLAGLQDPGVAVYFQRNAEAIVIACDSWDQVKDNLRACGLTLRAIRQIERSGASELLNRAFTGFKALAAAGETHSGGPDWREVLGVGPCESSMSTVRIAYRDLSRRNHPDHGGNAAAMTRINRAWEQAKEELGA